MKQMKDGRYAVGVDFGGTSVKLGLVNDHGEIKARKKILTSTLPNREAWMDAVAATVTVRASRSAPVRAPCTIRTESRPRNRRKPMK